MTGPRRPPDDVWAWLASEPYRSCRRTRWWFFRALGLVNLVAFIGVALEIDGLAGERGILPAAETFARAEARLGAQAYTALPSLGWLDPSGAGLERLAWAGAAVSVLLVAGVCPMAMAALAWALYLSLAVAGQTFFHFQWDSLLIETNFLAALAAPFALRQGRPSDRPGPSRASWWLLRLLLLRLVFWSGLVKLGSGDPTWRDLSALAYHYETQPLPTPLAWLVHQAPLAAHRACCASMLLLELVVPWLVFTRWRRAACIAMVALQLAIMATGNYAFFNVLALALCLTWWDDGVPSAQMAPTTAARALLPVCAIVIVASVPGSPFRGVVAPLRIGNPYGLFAVMTTDRPQISIEGRRGDGPWRPYRFRHQPGDTDRAPTLIAPLHARLDWQMWFAAKGPPEASPWFDRLCERLLEGSPAVVGLFAGAPFPDGPPTELRATLWQYRFTRAGEPGWWIREYVREYGP